MNYKCVEAQPGTWNCHLSKLCGPGLSITASISYTFYFTSSCEFL